MSFEAQRIRIELKALMLAEGKTTHNNAISRSHPESHPPTIPGPPTVDVVRAVHRDVRLPQAERLRITTEIVKLEQFGPPERLTETTEQFAYRVVTQYTGVPAAEVARREQVHPTRIRDIRKTAGLDTKGLEHGA